MPEKLPREGRGRFHQLWCKHRAGVREAIGVIGLLVAVLVLSVDIPRVPPFPQLLKADARGLLAVGALLVIVLVAPLVYETGVGVFRAPLLAFAATASVVVVAKLPAAMAPSSSASTRLWGTWGLRLVLVVALGALIGKLLLLHRFSGAHGAKAHYRNPEEELSRLLPFQRRDLERLRHAVLAGPADHEARVVQLVGRWGDGKSFLVQRLSPFLDHQANTTGVKKPCAVIVVDVWEQESEPDLYLAIVEEILGHKRYWYPYGWMRYPVSLFLARIARQFRLGLSAGLGGEARLEMPLTLPRPTGQRALERLVARVRGTGCRTVVVLDQADRAAPLIAQAAVTLALRALDLPGVVVILAYDDEMMRYKAFNPLIDTLPDLGSTMRALIFAEGPDRGRPEQPGGPLDPYNKPDGADGSLRRWEPWKNAEELQLKDHNGGSTTRPKGEAEPATDRDDLRLSEAVRLAYAGASPHDRRGLQRHFAQRSLASRPIALQRLGDHDVASMVVQFATLSYLVRDLVGHNEQWINEHVVPTTERALKIWKDSQKVALTAASIRELEGELFRRLSNVNLTEHKLQQVSPTFVAAVVVAAYDAAWRQYVRRRES